MDPREIRLLYAAEWEDFWSFVGGLTDDDRAAPSLCAGWSVQDVVTHVEQWDRLLRFGSPLGYVRQLAFLSARMLRAGLSMDRLNDRLSRFPPRTPAAHRRTRGEARHLFDRIAKGSQLAELVIHHQDIRRGLARQRTIPADRLVAALDGVRALPGVDVKGRARGIRWEASDVGWSMGRGPTVSGPGEAILMTMAGRVEPVDELSGDGVVVLRQRG